MSILTIFFLVFLIFIPIFIWAYIFSYISNEYDLKFTFLYGLFAGILSAGIILLYISFAKNNNIIHPFIELDTIRSLRDVLLSFFSVFSVLVFGALGLRFFLQKRWIHKKHFLTLILFSLGISFIYFILQKYFILSFSSIITPLLFVLAIASTEEWSKFHMFLSVEKKDLSLKRVLLIGVFVGLGFSFLENILYLYQEVRQSDFSGGFLRIFILRSVFTVFVHIMCTMITVRGYEKWKRNYYKISTVLIAFLWAIFLHTLFNFSLSQNYIWILFIYFFLGYMITGYFFFPPSDRIYER